MGFAMTLVIVNASWSLLNKWQFSKHKILAAATASPGFAVNRLMGDQQRTSGSSLTPTVTADDELDSWEKLYEEYDAANGKELRLRFLPDSDDQASVIAYMLWIQIWIQTNKENRCYSKEIC